MTDSTYDPCSEPLHTSRRTVRSQSAIQAHRGDVPSKHDEYLIQLQERNRLQRTYHNHAPPKQKDLKRRETGFQLYLNGAHSAPPRRPPSILNGPPNRICTPSPHFSDYSFPTPSNTAQQMNSLPSNGRGRWAPTTKTKIKTEEGSIIADVECTSSPQIHTPMPHSQSMFHHSPSLPSTSKRAVKSAATPGEAIPKTAWANQVIELDASQIKATGLTDETAFCRMKPSNIDQSWMPNWFTSTKPKEATPNTIESRPNGAHLPDSLLASIQYASDFEEPSDNEDDDRNLLNRVSLSLDDIPSTEESLTINEEIIHDKNKSQQHHSPSVGR